MAPQPSDPLSAASRLARLERAHLRLRRTFAACAVAAGALLVTAAVGARPRGDDVDARRVTLVDADGRACARLEVDTNGLPRLTFWDVAGRERAVLGVGTEDVSLSLRGADGQARLGLALDGSDHPHVVLSDAKHRPRMHLSVNPASHGNLILRGDDGTIAAGIGVLDDGQPWIRPATAAKDTGGR